MVRDLSGLDKLEPIGGKFEFEFVGLSSLHGLESLVSIVYEPVLFDGNLSLSGQLGSLQGLNNLKSIYGGLFLMDLPLIEKMDA